MLLNGKLTVLWEPELLLVGRGSERDQIIIAPTVSFSLQ